MSDSELLYDMKESLNGAIKRARELKQKLDDAKAENEKLKEAIIATNCCMRVSEGIPIHYYNDQLNEMEAFEVIEDVISGNI